MHPARGLRVWEAASELADDVRHTVSRLPRGQRYKLVDQLVRAADSIAATIAEGSGRKTVADQLNYYHMALASTSETLNHLKRCLSASLLSRRVYHRLANHASVTHRMLSRLIRKLEGYNGPEI